MTMNDVLKPTVIVVMYAKDEYNGYSNSHNLLPDQVYFEFTNVVDNIPGALIPMSDMAAAHLGKSLTVSSCPSMGGFIPPNVLYCGFENYEPTLMWYTNPQTHTLLFSDTDLKTVVIPVPGLIWLFMKNDLYLYAVKETPTPKTKLFKAPFANITDGRVCLGAGDRYVDKEFMSFDKMMNSVETVFWGTRFTHQSDTKIIKGNLTNLQKKLHLSKDEFPLDLLINTKKTINGIIAEKTGKSYHQEEEIEDTEDDFEDTDDDN